MVTICAIQVLCNDLSIATKLSGKWGHTKTNLIRIALGWSTFLMASVAPATAYAYIGPGAGISAIGAVLALIGAVALAIVGFVWYPLKRLKKNRQKARTETAKRDEKVSS
jgi:hypothetical protein